MALASKNSAIVVDMYSIDVQMMVHPYLHETKQKIHEIKIL